MTPSLFFFLPSISSFTSVEFPFSDSRNSLAPEPRPIAVFEHDKTCHHTEQASRQTSQVQFGQRGVSFHQILQHFPGGGSTVVV